MRTSSGAIPPITGLSASLGGAALLAGAAASGNITIAGARVGMTVTCNPTTFPGAGIVWSAYVSAANTVTVVVIAIIAATPTASTYSVRVHH